MNDESTEYLEELIENARKVEETLNTSGWKEVLKPALETQRDSLLTQLLSETEHERMLLTQQAAIAINNLLIFIDQIVADGDAARAEGRRRLTEHPVRDSEI